MISIS